MIRIHTINALVFFTSGGVFTSGSCFHLAANATQQTQHGKCNTANATEQINTADITHQMQLVIEWEHPYEHKV